MHLLFGRLRLILSVKIHLDLVSMFSLGLPK